jgi:hypothetical protein
MKETWYTTAQRKITMEQQSVQHVMVNTESFKILSSQINNELPGVSRVQRIPQPASRSRQE